MGGVFTPSNKSKIVLACTIIVSVFWFSIQFIDIYRFPVPGALYELVSVGMAVLLLGLPVFSFISWLRKKFDLHSLYFYSFLISLATILLLFLFFN
jgi:hypothetical protein